MSNARTRYIERARRKSTAARQQRIAAEQAALAALEAAKLAEAERAKLAAQPPALAKRKAELIPRCPDVSVCFDPRISCATVTPFPALSLSLCSA